MFSIKVYMNELNRIRKEISDENEDLKSHLNDLADYLDQSKCLAQSNLFKQEWASVLNGNHGKSFYRLDPKEIQLKTMYKIHQSINNELQYFGDFL